MFMIIPAYLLNKFLRCFLLANGGLTILFNLIEFFEKFARAEQASLKTITLFIGLNIVPSFFDLLPVASWMAICLFVYDLSHLNAWETFNIISISKGYLLRLTIVGGIIISVLGMVGKELAVAPLKARLEQFRQKKFKSKSAHKVYNQWFQLDENDFAYVPFLNCATGKGEWLHIWHLDEKFKVMKRIVMPRFSVHIPSAHFTAPHAETYQSPSYHLKKIPNFSCTLPSLIAQIMIRTNVPTLFKRGFTLITARQLLSRSTWHQEAALFLSELFSHAQPAIYIILSFALFLVFSHNALYRWLSVASLYPVLITIFSFSQFMVHHGASIWLMVLPYLVCLFLIIYCTHILSR